ncbi:MAG: hypothetical protein ACHQQ3_14185 [Gemmatimonadales bacterium]
MRTSAVVLLGCAVAGSLACATVKPPTGTAVATGAAERGTLARIYYWRARPGKMDEYSRYIRDVAEPIDREAQRAGAFLSVTTWVSHDSTSAWTHMRQFILRDSAQLAGLSPALDAAGVRVEPDSVKRRVRSQYSATLRDRVGDATVEVLR